MPQWDMIGQLVSKDILIAMQTSLGLIFLDLLLGILQSFTKGEFEPRKLPKFLQSSFLPYVGSLVLLGAFALFLPEIKVLFFASVAAVDAKFLFDVKDKVSQIVGVKVSNANITESKKK